MRWMNMNSPKCYSPTIQKCDPQSVAPLVAKCIDISQELWDVHCQMGFPVRNTDQFDDPPDFCKFGAFFGSVVSYLGHQKRPLAYSLTLKRPSFSARIVVESSLTARAWGSLRFFYNHLTDSPLEMMGNLEGNHLQIKYDGLYPDQWRWGYLAHIRCPIAWFMKKWLSSSAQVRRGSASFRVGMGLHFPP